MNITWDEKKRHANLKAHGLDFRSVRTVLNNATHTHEDTRFPYPERRYVLTGLLNDKVVVAIYTEFRSTFHVISFRKATGREAREYWQYRLRGSD
jgi:uncharacterized DUF497 family protein